MCKGKLVKTVLREVITGKNIKKLISHQRLAVQYSYVEIGEMTHAQGSLNLFFDFVDNPWYRSRDRLFIVDSETVYSQGFCLGRIEIDLFFGKTIDVSIVDSDHESVLGLGLKVNPHF